ncbi:hypothetical protein [Shewanella sp.]|uniref:hypothetical protein n=1 Tax=Shewanella sp. TaxID=50422 RepID=UPI003A975DC8
MDSELVAICENGKPEAPQRFAPWGVVGVGKGEYSSTMSVLMSASHGWRAGS